MLLTGNSLDQVLHAFQFVPALPRPNTTIYFRVANASRPPLKISPSPFKSSAWASLLSRYPGPIPRFGADLRYKVSRDVFILSKNLASALDDLGVIDRKLSEDLILKQVLEVPDPFISSPLGLVPKHNSGFRRIHHLSHPKVTSANDNIPDKALRYAKFQEVLDLIL